MKKDMTYAHRRAGIRVRLLDGQGQPLKNKNVRFAMTNHQFLFGSGAFDSLNVTDPEEENRAFYEDRMNKFLQVFNYGTIPFYWGQFEPVEGQPETESRMRAAKWLNAHGVKVKGHPLCWHTVCADWLMDYDNDTIFRKQIDRITREVTNFKGEVDMWDVINEVVIMPIFDKYDNAVTRICQDKGRVGLVKEVFAAAREANPGATLLINDFNLSTNYEILIDGCLNAGVPIDAIGIQSHQHQGYMGDEKLEEVLERYEHFGLPLHFTENTLISGELMPGYIVDLNDWQVDEWPSTPEGEERQKNEIEHMYRRLFAHPQVEAITGWDLCDGKWLKAPSGVLHKDNSVKPAFEMLKKLTHEEWWTDETARTDENGFLDLEGYKGDYEISFEGKTAKLKLDGGSEETQLILE